MDQKNYWLRGAILMSVLYVVLFFWIQNGAVIDAFDGLHFAMGMFLALPAIFVVPCQDIMCLADSSYIGFQLLVLINTIVYAVIGAGLGMLYGWRKNKIAM